MRPKTKKLIIQLFVIVLSFGCSQSPEYKISSQVPFDINPTVKTSDFTMLYRMSENRDSLGYSKITVKYAADSIIAMEQAEVNVNNSVLLEEIVTTLNADYSIRSNKITGKASGFPIDTKFKWSNNNIAGYSKFPDHPNVPIVELDTTVNHAHVERLVSIFFFPLLLNEYKTGFISKFKNFDSISGTINDITLEIFGLEKIQVDGNTRNLIKIRLSGGKATQLLYINPKTRIIEAIRFENIGWEYDLISNKE